MLDDTRLKVQLASPLRRGFVRAVGAFHPATVPLFARRSYTLEIATTFFFSIALACVEGGVIAVIVKKAFGDIVDSGLLNMAVAFVGAASEIANIISFVWTQWSYGKEKVAFINDLQGGVLIMVGAMAFVPVSTLGLGILVLCVIVARSCWSGIITLRPTLWRSNYPPRERARVVGRFSTVQVLMVAGMGVLLGRLMDVNPASFRIVLPIAAVCGFAGLLTYRHLRVRRAGRLLRSELSRPRVMKPWDGIGVMWRVLRQDRFFARFQLWLFVLGMGNLMTTPVLVLAVHDQFDLGYLQGILITSALTAVCTGATVPIWARFLDRSHVVEFRAVHSWVFVVGTGLLCLGVLTHQAWLLFAGSSIQGVGYGGGSIAWNLGHVDFAPPSETSQYMATHVTLNGIRGLLAPFVVVVIYNGVVSASPIAKTTGLAASVPLSISLLLTICGAFGYVALKRRMGRVLLQSRVQDRGASR